MVYKFKALNNAHAYIHAIFYMAYLAMKLCPSYKCKFAYSCTAKKVSWIASPHKDQNILECIMKFLYIFPIAAFTIPSYYMNDKQYL